MKKIEDEIQQTKFKSAHQKAVINLIYTSNWLYNKHQEFFKEFGITGQQFNILRILRGQFPQPISATEIKSRMLDRHSDVSRLLERLIIKNLVEKKINTEDKRAAAVLISEQGMELLKSIDKKEKELDYILAISSEEAQQLSDLLDKCRQ